MRIRISFLGLVLVAMAALAISCMSIPKESTIEEDKPDEPPIPFEEIESTPAKNTEDNKVNNTENVKEMNEIALTPPKNIKPLKIAANAIPGYYIPTHDFFDNAKLSKYALIINESDMNKFSWILCKINDTGKHENIGGGFFTNIDGGIDLEEYKLPDESGNNANLNLGLISRERFRAQFKPNELFIYKAIESDGKTAISKIIDEFGELYFVRIADTSDEPLPTSQIMGKFHPTDKRTGKKLTDSTLTIWSNGVWTFLTSESYLTTIKGGNSSSLKQVKLIGNWTISDEQIKFTRKTKCLLDSAVADITVDQPAEVFNFVFDTSNFALWLTLIKRSDSASVGLTQYLDANEVSIFIP